MAVQLSFIAFCAISSPDVATPPALALVEEGTIDGLIVQNVYNMGFWAVVAAYNAVHTAELHNPDEDWEAMGTPPTPVYIDPGCMTITTDNIADYLGEN